MQDAFGIVLFAVVGIVSLLLVLYGAGRLKLLGGSEEERKVLAGEKRP